MERNKTLQGVTFMRAEPHFYGRTVHCENNQMQQQENSCHPDVTRNFAMDFNMN